MRVRLFGAHAQSSRLRLRLQRNEHILRVWSHNVVFDVVSPQNQVCAVKRARLSIKHLQREFAVRAGVGRHKVVPNLAVPRVGGTLAANAHRLDVRKRVLSTRVELDRRVVVVVHEAVVRSGVATHGDVEQCRVALTRRRKRVWLFIGHDDAV